MGAHLRTLALDCRALLQSFSDDARVPASKLPTLPDRIDPEGKQEDAFTFSFAQKFVGETFDSLKASIPRGRKKELGGLEEKRGRIGIGLERYGVVKGQLDVRVCAAVAGALIALRVYPSKLNPLVRSIMNGVKSHGQFEDNLDIQTRSANAVAAFVSDCTTPTSGLAAMPAEKIVKNLCAFVCQDTDVTPVFSQSRRVHAGVLTCKLMATKPSQSSRAAKDDAAEAPEAAKARIVKRGAQLALMRLGELFGAELFTRLKQMWDSMVGGLADAFGEGVDGDKKIEKADAVGQQVVDSLTVLHVVVPSLDESLHDRVVELFPSIARALRSKYALVRQAASRSLATLCGTITIKGMRFVVEEVLSFLGDTTVLENRQGTMELIYHIVQKLDLKVLPYVIFLIVPVLGRMSDNDNDCRYVATNTFASLIRMAGLPDPPGFSEELLAKRESEREFLTQLLDGSKVTPYEIPIKLNVELRKYQQEGVNWLAFLAKYQLHGILCDALRYVGTSRDRQRLVDQIQQQDVVIASYDSVRNDIAHLTQFNWHYCILDEGHQIKNGKTKITQAVKMINARHRLLLSGTPIQNNVLELWSLFDFLMPGFLGTEQQFNERFGKPILANKDAKASAKTREAATLALEALHKQVLPFLLRRLKEQVLNDLPPKIIQDHYCELSDMQKYLYDAFSESQAGSTAQGAVTTKSANPNQQHVFQSLQYLRKLCNHPALIVKDAKQEAELVERFSSSTKGEGASKGMRDVRHAPKLLALRQLLNDCGIGAAGEDGDALKSAEDTDISSQHRVLIFCQMRQMLDIIEEDLFRLLMPSVTYMRLDGSTPASQRHGVVQTFNSDPSIDCLLLTTSKKREEKKAAGGPVSQKHVLEGLEDLPGEDEYSGLGLDNFMDSIKQR
ncbi:TATA-binding protein-associated factor mot1 [Ceratobasidium sp. 392]|nr:TATA-binding protein-associated factor mot1 [Ceratobasidium sp. 392]